MRPHQDRGNRSGFFGRVHQTVSHQTGLYPAQCIGGHRVGDGFTPNALSRQLSEEYVFLGGVF